MGQPVGSGPPRMAHRMQRHGHRTARRPARYPLRRGRQHLPPPRSGNRPDRMLHRAKIRQSLDALRPPHGRRTQDGQVLRQFLHPARSFGKRLERTRGALRASLRPLPPPAQLHLRRTGRGAQRVAAARRMATTPLRTGRHRAAERTEPARCGRQICRRPRRRPQHLRRSRRTLRSGARHQPRHGPRQSLPRTGPRPARLLGAHQLRPPSRTRGCRCLRRSRRPPRRTLRRPCRQRLGQKRHAPR